MLQRVQHHPATSSKRAAGGRIELTSSGDTPAIFDADRLSQVFSNLVGNALQHGEPDAPIW